MNHLVYFISISAGEITSDGLGYSPRSGPSYKRGSRPVSGGGHGGNGGRASYQFQSPLAYDSIYMPEEKGSGGGGGSGGGIVYINISDMFRLEGNVRANGMGSNYGGGAGGTVMVRTKHFDGMGTIETKGGIGSSASGGGGGGGRIALYHSGISTFTGGLQAFGGESLAERGGAGTVYVQDESGNATQRQLIIDNGHLGASSNIKEIRQVSISGNSISPYFYVTSYTSPGGITLSTSGTPRCARTYIRDRRICISGSGQLSHLFSGSGSDGFYYTSSSTPDISYNFPYPMTVDHLRIFPQCSADYWSNFHVQAYLKNILVYSQALWTETTFCRQGQYGRVNIGKEVDKASHCIYIYIYICM